MESETNTQDPAKEQLQPIIDLYVQGQLQQALALAGKTLQHFPNSVILYNILGASNAGLMQFDTAIDCYKKAVSIKPDYAEAFYNMGNAMKRKGDLEAATDCYKKAIDIKPDYAEAIYNMGNAMKNNGDSEAAIDYYKKAISIKPDYAEALSNMGAALQDKGDLEAAIDCYKKAISIKPDYAEALSNMGAALQDKGDLEAAIDCYKKAISIKPDYAEAYSGIGEAYLTTGDYAQSARFYETSIELRADNSDMLEKTQNMLLKTLYFLDDKPRFYEHLDKLKNLGQKNAIIGSFSCRASGKYGGKPDNGFCSHPMDYVLEKSLIKVCDFEKFFVKPAKEILKSEKMAEKRQPLLLNGHQTAGNLFATESHFSPNVKVFIEQEIGEYRHKFKDNLEGLIKHWPSDYIIYGWLVSMKNGGAIRPHMHENGWISGSIYINVPRSPKKDSGNLVLCVEDPKYTTDQSPKSKKIVDVNTGSLCLFPSSLLHYTIPFESTEDRIVLAFDVVPK